MASATLPPSGPDPSDPELAQLYCQVCGVAPRYVEAKLKGKQRPNCPTCHRRLASASEYAANAVPGESWE